jgi:iron complex transport system ATP-binding protein
MVAAAPLLEFVGVSFGYGPTPVLSEVSLTLAAGEMVALLGRNGSGKSTLLSLAAGLRRPEAGEVRFAGADLARLAPHERARRIAMVPQAMPVPFAFTVRELVSLGRTPYVSALRGEREADRAAVATAMERAGVTDLAGRLAGELSGGEQQRVALALALAQEPALLLLDEATAHLDLHHQAALLRVARDLNRRHGLTVLAAIHDVNLAALWFDRLLLLDDRRLLADGPPAAVLRPDLLQRAFGSPVLVLEHPTAGVPMVALERPTTNDE